MTHELKSVAAFIARENPHAAKKVAAGIRLAGNRLGTHSTGRKGRVGGTFEKSVPNLRYIIAYAVETAEGRECVVILRLIHSARDWKSDSWPEG